MAIFSLIGTAIAGALFAGSALAASVIAGGLAFAASLGLQYLRRPKKRAYTAVQGETQYGGNVPVSTLFGPGKTKGHRTFYAKWGAGNKYNAEVFLLANGWCDGLEPYVYFYGKKWNLVARPVTGNEVAHYGVETFQSGGTHLFSIRFYDGRPWQRVDTKLVNDTAALGQKWKATSVNAGICYVVVERLYNASLFDKGKPDIEFVLRGLREYDPRLDSTVVGGSGPQRINDPSTWVFTKNVAVHRLNYQLGVRALISGRTLIGEGKSLGQIDLATYFVAMNVCDTVRANGKKTYECSLWVSGDDDHTEILKEFDDAMAGYGLNRRGLSGVIAGAPQVPVLEIAATDIPADRAQDVQFRKSAFDRYNYMSGQFTSIEAMWNPESLTPVTVNADVAADGRPRQVPNDFLQVTDPDIAQYLLNIRYRQNRRGGTATVPVSRRVGLKVQEGEWIVWSGRTWMISEWLLDERLRPTLKLSETGADIYDDDDIEPGPVIIPPTPPVNPSVLTTIQNFRVDAGIISGANGFDVPVLRFTWTPPDDPTITAIRIFYQPTGATEIFEETCTSPEAGEFTTSKNVLSNKAYSARATITTIPDRFKTYTPWVASPTATGALALLTDLSTAGKDVRDVYAGLRRGLDDLRPVLQQILEDMQLIGASSDSARRKLAAQVDSNRAAFDEQIVVVADQLSAIAEQITDVVAAVDDRFAQGRVRFTAAANQEGVLARFSVQLRLSVDDVWWDAGYFLEIVESAGVVKSRFAVMVDQFVVASPSRQSFLPLVFEDGELKLQVANIGTVRSGRLLAQNNKVDFNLNTGRLIFRS